LHKKTEEATEEGLREYLAAISWQSWLALLFVLAVLYMISRYSYLLFHSLVELVSITMACGIFLLAWNARRISKNQPLLFLGVAYLFVAILDLLHTLSYKGMGTFPQYGANLPTQLWIAARYLEALSLLLVPFFVGKELKATVALGAYALVTALLLSSIFFVPIFPLCFHEQTGLTLFKKISEGVICAILLGAALHLLRRSQAFDRHVLFYLLAAIGFTIGAEIFFIFYTNVYGLSNLLGHYLKLFSYYVIYKALVESGLLRPYALLFRDLAQSREALHQENAKLLSLKKELEEQNKRLEELNQEKNAILGTAAHDIRSPLSVIKGYSSLLQDQYAEHDDGMLLEFLSIITRKSEFSLRLLNKLLDLSAIESGQIQLELEEIALEELIGKNLEAYRHLAAPREMEIALEAPPQLPRVKVDPTRLEQVLLNLLTNAIKFSPRGEEVIIALQESKRELLLSVSDHGCGVKPEEIDHLFRPFAKAKSSAKKEKEGAGLGLAIVRKVVEGHGGRIWVESDGECGATFYVALPLEKPEEPVARESLRAA
jgi:signal transduction histidine kinase